MTDFLDTSLNLDTKGGGDYADDLLSDAQLSDSIFLDINKFPDA